MTNIQTLTAHELYTKSKELLTRELLGEDVAWRTEKLFEECKRRDVVIWEKALEDAHKISASVETTYESYGTYPNSYARIVKINRLDFCTPQELKQVLGIKAKDIDSIIKLIDTNYFCSKVYGNSMSGIGINTDDTLIIEKTDKVKDNSVAIVSVAGTQLIKRLNYTDEGMILKSENPKFPPMFVPFGEATPFGVVKYCIKAIS